MSLDIENHGEIYVDSQGRLYVEDEQGNEQPLSVRDLDATAINAADASVANAPTEDTDVARKTEVDGKADDPHDLGGGEHNADTLANLNSKVSDATLDGEGDTRPPESHGEGSHDAEVIHEGDSVDRKIWVIESGAGDPSGAGNDDLIFEKED